MQVVVDEAAGSIVLSKIFDWYGRDFAPEPAGVLQWIAQRLSPDKRASLEHVLARTGTQGVSYATYDWSANFPKV